MSTTDKDECCVCGKETAQRCSACSKAGFSLFFCSKECQKLVGFAHKTFCGPNSKPFTFPPLQADEAEDLRRYFDAPYEAAEVLKFNVLNLFRNALRSIRFPNLPSGPASGMYSYPFSSITPLYAVTKAAAVYSTTMAEALSTLVLPTSLAYPVKQDWYSSFLHHLVVLAALNYRDSRALHDEAKHPNSPMPLSPADAARRAARLAPPLSMLRRLIREREAVVPAEGVAMMEALDETASRVGIKL
ncbi:hypothetical protein JCM8097_000066 [Rhodosporidiobolus ruineniae]